MRIKFSAKKNLDDDIYSSMEEIIIVNHETDLAKQFAVSMVHKDAYALGLAIVNMVKQGISVVIHPSEDKSRSIFVNDLEKVFKPLSAPVYSPKNAPQYVITRKATQDDCYLYVSQMNKDIWVSRDKATVFYSHSSANNRLSSLGDESVKIIEFHPANKEVNSVAPTQYVISQRVGELGTRYLRNSASSQTHDWVYSIESATIFGDMSSALKRMGDMPIKNNSIQVIEVRGCWHDSKNLDIRSQQKVVQSPVERYFVITINKFGKDLYIKSDKTWTPILQDADRFSEDAAVVSCVWDGKILDIRTLPKQAPRYVVYNPIEKTYYRKMWGKQPSNRCGDWTNDPIQATIIDVMIHAKDLVRYVKERSGEKVELIDINDLSIPLCFTYDDEKK